MRHDPAAAAIVIMLRSLKMYGMAQAVEDLIEQGAPAFEAAIPILSQLLKAELAEREVRSCRVALKGALPHFVWRNYPEAGKFRRDSHDFEAPLVARGRSFGSKRRAK